MVGPAAAVFGHHGGAQAQALAPPGLQLRAGGHHIGPDGEDEDAARLGQHQGAVAGLAVGGEPASAVQPGATDQALGSEEVAEGEGRRLWRLRSLLQGIEGGAVDRGQVGLRRCCASRHGHGAEGEQQRIAGQQQRQAVARAQQVHIPFGPDGAVACVAVRQCADLHPGIGFAQRRQAVGQQFLQLGPGAAAFAVVGQGAEVQVEQPAGERPAGGVLWGHLALVGEQSTALFGDAGLAAAVDGGAHTQVGVGFTPALFDAGQGEVPVLPVGLEGDDAGGPRWGGRQLGVPPGVADLAVVRADFDAHQRLGQRQRPATGERGRQGLAAAEGVEVAGQRAAPGQVGQRGHAVSLAELGGQGTEQGGTGNHLAGLEDVAAPAAGGHTQRLAAEEGEAAA